MTLLLGGTQQAGAQQIQMIPRSQLFAAVLGQDAGIALNNAMNAYALGKAAREDLDTLRQEITKCGDSCSADLKAKLHKQETAQATAEEVIDDAALRNNMPVAWANALKSLLNIEPQAITQEQKEWNDIQTMGNIISAYCYTTSDQTPEKQRQCEMDTPYNIAKDVDILINNMCREKISRESGLNLNDTSLQHNNDIKIVRQYNHALGSNRECFENTSYYYGWMKSVYENCGRDWNDRRNFSIVMKPKDVAQWCVPDPTDDASNNKLVSWRDVEFDSGWLLNPAMTMVLDVRPKVHECIYGAPNTTTTAKLYFWGEEPPGLKFRTNWGGTTTGRFSDVGRGGEKFAYDMVGDGHYLGIKVADKCPTDLEKAIRLRQALLKEAMPTYLR